MNFFKQLASIPNMRFLVYIISVHLIEIPSSDLGYLSFLPILFDELESRVNSDGENGRVTRKTTKSAIWEF